jgi:hypothetical protein
LFHELVGELPRVGLGVLVELGAELVVEVWGYSAAWFCLGHVAVVGVFDDGVGDSRFGVGPGAAEVVSGDLEAVEEQPRAFRVNGVVGDAAQHLGERELDGSVVVQAVESREVEARPGLPTALVGGHRGPIRMVVVAEVLAAKRARAALVAVDEDMTAEVVLARGFWLFWFWSFLLFGFWWMDLDGLYDRQLGDGRLGDG